MPDYEEDDRFQPIAPIQPIRQVKVVRAIHQRLPQSYLGNRKGSHGNAESDSPEEPAVILDISPQAREQAHHLEEKASDDPTSS